MAVDRRCLCSKWVSMELLEVMKVLQNYDVRCGAKIYGAALSSDGSQDAGEW